MLCVGRWISLLIPHQGNGIELRSSKPLLPLTVLRFSVWNDLPSPLGIGCSGETRLLGYIQSIRVCFSTEGYNRVGCDPGSNSLASSGLLQIPVGLVHPSNMEILYLKDFAQGFWPIRLPFPIETWVLIPLVLGVWLVVRICITFFVLVHWL